ncbi:SMC-Scp complex subunit ScpB [Candidatus Giovannonibacteria bacterium]|nr:SMC-Scp complex subunit ScpB [Candidatus Giovannonibacteria bacterium]
MDNLSQKIEAVLFLAGAPLNISRLSHFLKEDKDKIIEALDLLSKSLENRGIRLIKRAEEYSFASAPEFGSLARDFLKEEVGEDLSKAALETLSIIVYKGPISRTEIDYIRGVNSSFTLRNLLIRGLVLRVQDLKDSRVHLYEPSLDFLKYMGIEKIEKLPHYLEFKKELEEFSKSIKKDKEGNDL